MLWLTHICSICWMVGASIKIVAADPRVYMAGDSTMALGGGGPGTQGWAEYLKYSLRTPVINDAIAGRSARSYTREGHFAAIADQVQPGDFVVIEFGHNDGGSLTRTDNGRTDCPGTGDETCHTTYNGVAEVVLTFPKYIKDAVAAFSRKGAISIVASQTPDNTDQTSEFNYTPSRFVGYAQVAAASSNSIFINHGGYVAKAYQRRSVATVKSYYPLDHTHTSPEGANVVATAFVRGLLCSDSLLKSYVINSTRQVEGTCN